MTTNDADLPAASVRLAALSWGPETNDPTTPQVLLLHGLTSAAGTWWQVASALADAGCAVTAVDLRGHGASPRTDRYLLSSYAADVTRVTPTVQPARPWNLVVGHSLGGAVAIVAADAHPHWADALLLLDPVLAVGPESMDGLLDELLGDLRGSGLDADALLQAHPRWHSEDAVQKVNAARVVSPFVVERTVRDNPDWQLEARAARLRPTLRVLAADAALDASFRPELGARLGAANPRFSYAEVTGSGHSVQRDDPARVVREARELLGDAPAG